MSQHRNPTLLLGVMLLVCAAAGCGSSDRIVVEVEPPLDTATIVSYTGWFPGPWHQEILVTLAQEAELREVVDLSVFGDLRPGMGLDDATAVLGPPTGRRVDHRGDEWNYWTTPTGTIELSCRRDESSSDRMPSHWDLRARPESLSAPDLLHPAVVAAVALGERSKPEVEHRAVRLYSPNFSESATLTLVSRWGGSLRWWGGYHWCD